MSVVENLVNQISTNELGGITKPSGFNLDDDTFANLLEKQLNSTQELSFNNNLGNFGVPAGLLIEPLEGIEFSETAQDQMEIVGEKISREEYLSQPIEFKDIDMGDYFSNLLKTDTKENPDFFNFAKKQATHLYNYKSKNLVMNAAEFLQDAISS